jgi:hypothetical protein
MESPLTGKAPYKFRQYINASQRYLGLLDLSRPRLWVFPDCADAAHAAYPRELRPFRADLRRS